MKKSEEGQERERPDILYAYGFHEEEWFCSNRDLVKIKSTNNDLPKINDLIRCKDWSHYQVPMATFNQNHRYIHTRALSIYKGKHLKFSSDRMKIIYQELSKYRQEFNKKRLNIIPYINKLKKNDWVNGLFYLSNNELNTIFNDFIYKTKNKLITYSYLKENAFSKTIGAYKISIIDSGTAGTGYVPCYYDDYFFLDYYIPKRNWNDSNCQFSKNILNFKDGDSGAIRFFNKKLNIFFKGKLEIWSNYAIAMCPSSKESKSNSTSSMSLLLKKLISMNPSRIFDASELIYRNESISKSRSGAERTIKKHVDSIKLNKDLLNNLKNLKMERILIFDDILTTASTINACEYLLKKHLGESIHVVKFTLGRTKSDRYYNQLTVIDSLGVEKQIGDKQIGDYDGIPF